MEDLDQYFHIIIGRDAGIIFLCVVGAVLNVIMLYMLLSKKQIRSSVHTVYMVQIAVTDLLVCMVWLILTSVLMHDFLEMKNTTPEYYGGDDNNQTDSNVAKLADKAADESQYRKWRIMYYLYNFHYYTNIFLLASMSVERCAAVWKSMKCQRYQYNRKVIIGVSVIMWATALACVMPDLINPDLIVSDSDSPRGLTRTIYTSRNGSGDIDDLFVSISNRDFAKEGLPQGGSIGGNRSLTARPYETEKRNYEEDTIILHACSTLLKIANDAKKNKVHSHGKLSVHSCLLEIVGIVDEYNPVDEYSIATNEDDEYYDYGSTYSLDDSLLELPEETDASNHTLTGYGDEYESIGGYNPETGGGMDIAVYKGLLDEAFKGLENHHETYKKIPQGCDPDISHPARIYVLVVNLVIGFFIPFSIIVFSYVSISCMIGKRVRSRTEAQIAPTIQMRDKKPSRSQHDSMSRRMSDFMRYVLLRKPHDGAENKSFMTDSDRHLTRYGSGPKMPYSTSVQRSEEHNSTTAQSDDRSQYEHTKMPVRQSSQNNQIIHPEFEEALRQLNSVTMRHENSRPKKYSAGYDTTNENIPQTIEEHPLEQEDANEEDGFLRSSNGSSTNDVSSPGMRTTPPYRMVPHRNSGGRRESGGSYGSSTMDSMATDQTSLMTSLDKRYSAATTTSALTPPTPIEASNPCSNQFFPANDERMTHARTPSGDANYKPGSKLNDVTFKLYRNSLQRKQYGDAELDQFAKFRDGMDEQNAIEGTTGMPANRGPSSPRDRYSYPHTSRNKVTQNERPNSARLSYRQAQRPQNDNHSPPPKEQDNGSPNQHPKYYRQNSSGSTTVFYSRGRTYSTGGSHASSRKNIVLKTAERQLRVSRTLLAYVIVFSICWLPQRITYLLYVIDALIGASSLTCYKLLSGVRLLSFVSVLLNPVVYIISQRQFQDYLRKSACVKSMRRWHAKCFKRSHTNQESSMDSRFRGTTDKNEEMELQERRDADDRDLLLNNRQQQPVPNTWTSYRIQGQTRPAAHPRKAPAGSPHDMFAPPVMRRHDATIDEMKEEEAAAEESLEKEMKRLEAEEERRRKDDINKNFMLDSSEDDILNTKNGSGSGTKTSSSSKSENIEEFLKRLWQSNVTQLPTNGMNQVKEGLDSNFGNLGCTPRKTNMPNGTSDVVVLE